VAYLSSLFELTYLDSALYFALLAFGIWELNFSLL